MDSYTYDAESTELTDEELRAFATLVQGAVHVDVQHAVSIKLSSIKVPVGNAAADYVQRFARGMWQTAIRTTE